MPLLEWIIPELSHRFVQGQDVLNRCARLYIVYGIENEAASRTEDFDPLPDFIANLLRRSERQRALGIDSPAPEG